MSGQLNILDTVALLRDKPEANLSQGQVGTVVEAAAEGCFLIEFSGDDGKTYAVLPIAQNELLKLQFTAEAAE